MQCNYIANKFVLTVRVLSLTVFFKKPPASSAWVKRILSEKFDLSQMTNWNNLLVRTAREKDVSEGWTRWRDIIFPFRLRKSTSIIEQKNDRICLTISRGRSCHV